MPDTPAMTAGELAELACVLEVTAPKAGNVHPGADFDDVTWADFVVSAALIRPTLDRVNELGVGGAVLQCVRDTSRVVGCNTNLGLVLLLAPLCAATTDVSLREGVARVLRELTDHDAQAMYTAIAEAKPGGLGRVAKGDVQSAQVLPIVEAMRLASNRDAVARQYATGFADVLDRLASRLADLIAGDLPLDDAIVRLHLEQMAHEPDSLIVRKCGDDSAARAQRMAAATVAADWPGGARAAAAFDELDAYLRDDGHQRNPGTSADLVGAAVFVTMWQTGARPTGLPWRASIVGADA